ncbi:MULTISPECIES: GNAT family N-acetyltransferase [Fusobacterium]|uniref:GNAT family N-acetyltransferase n=1 Tax=Fusobacterium TaxID=848 RepID=UPI00197E47C5|nr:MULTISPECIES: GNAT family protein [Fusobacterium]
MIFLRKTKESDIENIYNNIHLSYIRKYYPTLEKEQWENHRRWYKFLIKSSAYLLYTITNIEEEFLGYIKFELDGEIAIINIYLIEKMRKKKYSSSIIKMSIENLIKEKKEISIVLAYILEENIASIKAFKKNDFIFDSMDEYKGIEHMLFIKTLIK